MSPDFEKMARDLLPCTCGAALPKYRRDANKHFAGCPTDEIMGMAEAFRQLHDDTLERAAVVADQHWSDRNTAIAGPESNARRLSSQQIAESIRTLKSPDSGGAK